MSRRTLIITNDFPPRVGGIESFVLAMAQRLDPASVVVHTARQEGDSAFDASLPFAVVRDPARLMLPTPAITRRSVAIARRFQCDSVWFGAAAPLGLMASVLKARGPVRRTVATTHGHEVWWAKAPAVRRVLRLIGDRNDVLTYTGEYTRSEIARALSPAAAGRMAQLTPGVDTLAFRPDVDGTAVRRLYGLGDRPVVVCVSRFVARKGQDVLVAALPEIRRAVPDAALLLVGDGPMRAKLQRLARDLGVAEEVVFTGPKPWAELPPHFAAGDVFCMPTRTRKAGLEVEGLGIVYLEAAASGLPVVAGNSGGAPETVDQDRTGLVVDGRSTRSVAAAVGGLLADPERARTMGAAGRARVLTHWSWTRAEAALTAALSGRS